MLFETVLNARNRVMLEMNCAEDKFDNLIKGIPSMKSPTVSPLHGDDGFGDLLEGDDLITAFGVKGDGVDIRYEKILLHIA